MNVWSAAGSTCAAPMSLATYVAGLGEGSVCFSCGGEMRPPKGTGVVSIGAELVAVCTTCGSEIALVEEEAEAVTPACSGCSRLVAAA